MLDNLKSYHKRFLAGSITDLDESGTRIMINHFLSDVLGYAALEEIRTEYMIKGTYADYMIQVNGKRHFLVEVKAFSLTLNESHLRQTVNYGANEGIDWALLTNGKQFDFYKILFEKPISHKRIFSVDLTDPSLIKKMAEFLQYLSRDSTQKKGLDSLWSKSLALTPDSMSKILLSSDIVCIVRKSVNKMFDTKFSDEKIQESILEIISEKIDISSFKIPRLVKKPAAEKTLKPTDYSSNIVDEIVDN
ncbi:MAG: type I restriction enzyme HsdR N-terminal domain-containing protein [Chitinophagaceae bacterium]